MQVYELFRIVLKRNIKPNHRTGRGLTGKHFTELNFKLKLVLFADEVESFLGGLHTDADVIVLREILT